MVWKERLEREADSLSGVIVIAPLQRVVQPKGKKSSDSFPVDPDNYPLYCDRISTPSPHLVALRQWQITVLPDTASA